MKKLQRFLALLLTAVMLLGYIPAEAVHVHAAETDSGTCGDSLTWSFDGDTGVLTISGSGAMDHYDDEDYAPWWIYRERILSVVIAEGVTSVGSWAFAVCTKMTDISLPDSMASFGERAFSGCTSLTSVEIPSQTTIYDYTFSGCDSLTQVEIPNGVSTIGNNAFYGAGLTSVVIPDSVIEIKNNAFQKSDLEEVTISSGVRLLYETCFADCANLTTVWFTGNAPSAGASNVFSDSPVTAYYPAGNETWTESAMACISRDATWKAYCTADHNYGEGVVTEPACTEQGYTTYTCTLCGDSYEDDYVDPVGHSFEGDVCGSCGESLYPITGACGENLTWSLSADGTLTISGSGDMADYVDYEPAPWWDYRENITSVVLEAGITSVGEFAFYSCYNVTSISLGSVTEIGVYAFAECAALRNLVIPDSVVTVGNYAFQSCTGLETATVGTGVTNVGNCAFAYCAGLKEITFAGEAPTLDANAFYDTVTTVRYPVFVSWEDVKDQNYGGTLTWLAYDPYGCIHEYETVVTEPTCTDQGYTTYTCTLCGESYVDDHVDATGKHTYEDGICTVCGASHYPITGTCGENLTWTLTEDGTLTISGEGDMENYSSVVESPWWCDYSDQITKLLVQPGVTAIGDWAFGGCHNLTAVTIPDSVTRIGNRAFSGCYNLPAVTIPNSVTTIGEFAFNDCTKFNSITIPNSVISIGDYAFSSCPDLTTVQLSAKLTAIPNGLFDNCRQLSNVTLPDTVTSIGACAFYDCTSLTSITIPATVEIIGDYGFTNCRNLSEITFAGDAPKFGSEVFRSVNAVAYYPYGNDTWTAHLGSQYSGTITWTPYCADEHSYEAVVTEPTCTERGYTTYTCTFCGDSYADDYVDATGEHTYEDGICTGCGASLYPITGICGENLTWVLTEDGTLTISGTGDMNDYTYSAPAPWYAYVEQIVAVVVEEGVTSLGNSAFYNCYNIASVSLNSDLVEIGDWVFWNINEMTTLVIPDSVTKLGQHVFDDCDKLSHVTLGSGITTIPQYAFQMNPAMESFVVPDTVKVIESMAFAECWNLKSLELGTGVTNINSSAFQNCNKLTQIVFRGDAPTMGIEAFYDIEATAYYPSNDTWTSDKLQNYGGTITWVSYNCEGDNHIYEAAVTKEPSCTEEGITTYSCVICGSSYEEALAVTDHSYAEEVLREATCTEEGTTAYTCTACGYSYEEVLDALGHDHHAGICTRCGDSLFPVSGTCGENLTWTLTEDGVLTISGTGAMTNFANMGAPWADYIGSITSVIVEEGVTTIGNSAFYYCQNLQTISIPEGVTSIGSYAFYYGYALQEINLPSTLTYIGGSAFYTCKLLETVVIPEGVTQIYKDTFHNCYKLKSVVIPDTVTAIGNYAFQYCYALEEVTIPDSVTTIGDYAFADNESLRSITIGSGVTQLSDRAFAYNPKLSTIYFRGDAPTFEFDYTFYNVTATVYYPRNNDTWDSSAKASHGGSLTWVAWDPCEKGHSFADDVCTICGATNYIAKGTCGENLTWVLSNDYVLTISGTGPMTQYTNTAMVPWNEHMGSIVSVVIEEGVTTLSGHAFNQAKALTSVDLATTLESIGDRAFYQCEALTSIEIPDSVTAIGGYAFDSCKKLESVKLPQGLTRISDALFTGCSSLKTIDLPETITSIGVSAFNGSGLETIEIPNRVTSIGQYAFEGCRLTTLVIPDSVTELGMYAFTNCTSLQTLTIGSGLKILSEGAFGACDNLETVVIPDTVEEIGDLAFAACNDLCYVEIGTGVTAIGYEAFYSDGMEIEEFRFRGDAPSIHAEAFRGTTTTAYYPAGNDTWTEDILQQYEGTITWVSYDPCGDGHSYVDGVCTVCGTTSYIAKGTCGENLTWVLSNDYVLTISGTGAMTEYAYETAVPWYAYMDSIVSVLIGDEVTSIAPYAFYEGYSLESVTLGGSVETIGTFAFTDCIALTSVEIPESVHTIENYAFQSCTKLESVTLTTSISSINMGVFRGCRSLKTITLPESITTIYSSAFADSGLESIVIPGPVSSIGDYAFQACESLKSVTLSHSLQTIGSRAFYVCPELKEITFAGNAPTIAGDAFKDLESTVYYPADKSGWTEDVLQQYEGTITWTPYCADEHSYEAVVTEPTCTEQGYTTYTCTVCGDSYADDYVDAIGEHSYEVTVVESACNVWGYTTYTCTSCGYSYEEHSGYADHNYALEEVIPPTCTEYGYEVFTCTVCGDSYTDPEDAPTGHSYESVVTDPTCVEDGYTTHTCTVCGDSYVDDTVEAPGHNYEKADSSSEPTCKDQGCYVYRCIVCGDVYEETVESTGEHTYESVVTEPTCTEQGYTTYTCTVCGDSYSDDYVDSTGHNHEYRETQKPTCTEVGSAIYICTVCGDYWETPGADPTGHDYEEKVTAPTCTEDGITIYTCATCGDSYSEPLMATGHSYVNGVCTVCGDNKLAGYPELQLNLQTNAVITQEAVDENNGLVYFVFTPAQTDLYRIASSASMDTYVHLYNANLNELAINDDGSGNQNFQLDYVLEAGTTYVFGIRFYSRSNTGTIPFVLRVIHSYTENIITAPTCTTEGEAEFTCAHCGDSYVGSVPMADHSYDAGIVTKPTCNAQGYTTYTCTLCGDSYTDNYTAPIAHSYVAKTTMPTCTQAGYTTYTCGCGASYIADDVAALGHNYENGTCNRCFAAEPLGYGVCGPNLYWEIDENNVLVIYGSGNMYDYEACEAPWYDFASEITGVAIGNSVTRIGAYAFCDLSGITTLTIPANVQSIGYSALTGCGQLTDLTIPFVGAEKNVTGTAQPFGHIFGEVGYHNCITVEHTNGTFYYVPKNLTTVTVTGGTLYGYAFHNCSKLVTINLRDNVVNLEQNVFSGCTSLKHINIASGLTSIGSHTFQDCESLETVAIGDSVTSIGYEAFRGCTSLKSIILPDSLESISSYAFFDCTSLEAIEIPEGVTTIQYETFYNCTALASVKLPSTLKSIGSYAFYNCTSLEELELPNGLTSMDYNAFSNCASLTAVKIPGTLKIIPSGAFSGCSSLTTVEIPRGVTTINSGAFSGCSALTDVTMVSVARIDSSAFSGCSSLQSIELPTFLGTLGESVFSGCTSLESMVIPENIVELPGQLFYGCTALTDVTLSPDTISIGDSAFYGCTALKGIELPAGITTIGSGAFQNSGIASIELPAVLTSFGSYVFSNCDALESVVIPEGVTTVGASAFYDCDRLQSVALPDSIVSIGSSVFRSCDLLQSIEIPSGVTAIGAYAFAHCDLLNDVALGDGLREIDNGAFYECHALESMDLPATLETIGEYAFSGCNSLETLIFRGDAPAMASEAFRYIHANAYYPVGNANWTEDVRQDYGAYTLRWLPLGDVKAPVLAVTADETDSYRSILSWDAVEGAVRYDIYAYRTQYNDFMGMYALNKVGSTTDTTCTDTTIEPGYYGWYVVAAVDAQGGQSFFSNLVKNQSMLMTPVLTSVERISDNYVRITWEAVEYADYYRILRSTSIDGDYEEINTIWGDTLYDDSSVEPGKTYYYKISAHRTYDVSTSSQFSNVISLDIPLIAPGMPVVMFEQLEDGTRQIRVSWEETQGAVSYELYRSNTENGKYTRISTQTDSYYADTNLEIGKGYYYKVKAIAADARYNSDFSGTATDCVPLARPQLTVTYNAEGHPVFSWSPIENAKKYELRYPYSGNLLKSTTETSFTYTGLALGDGADIYLVAVAEDTRASTSSDSIWVARKPAQPVVSIANDASSGKPELTWEAVEGASYYKIYRSTSTIEFKSDNSRNPYGSHHFNPVSTPQEGQTCA